MPPDTIHRETLLKKIGFGSCSNQLKPHMRDAWETMRNQGFEAWIWGGDVVYATKGNSVEALRTAYDEMRREGSYHSFVKSLPELPTSSGETTTTSARRRRAAAVMGVFDDHDLGINDGGKHTPQLDVRQNLFLDFLEVDKNDPRRKRDGVYNSHDFGPLDEIRVILLDTRSGRSDHVIPGIGHWGKGTPFGKLSPFIAAATRSLSAFTGLTLLGDTERHILSETQWRWLEDQLFTSRARLNVIVSSVQVLTTNPSVESWGHFPSERRRLLELIRKSKAASPLILSGDVHVGEFFNVDNRGLSSSTTTAASEWGARTLLEATSSGITHSFTGLQKNVMLTVHALFGNTPRGDVFVGRNFGSITIDYERGTFNVSIHDIAEDGIVRLSAERKLGEDVSELFFPEGRLPLPNGPVPNSRAVRAGYVSLLVLGVLMALWVMRWGVRRLRGGKMRSGGSGEKRGGENDAKKRE